MTEIAAYLGAWFGTASIVWQLFERADKAVKDSWKRKLSAWLLKFDPRTDAISWSEVYVISFDKALGPKHLSWQRFLRSCILTSAGVLIWVLVETAKSPGNFLILREYTLYFHKLMIWTTVLALTTNFLSFTQTRLLVGLYADFLRPELELKTNSLKTIVWPLRNFLTLPLAILDIGFKIAFGFAITKIQNLLFDIDNRELGWLFDGTLDEERLTEFVEDKLLPIQIEFDIDMMDPLNIMPIMLIFLYFLPSIWFWLVFLSTKFIRLLSPVWHLWHWGRNNFLDVENRPFHALGLVSSLIVGVVYLFGGGILFFVK